MNQKVKGKVRYFIESHINVQLLEDESDIFQLGYVNSLFAMQLVSFIEKEFNIKVENDELKINNFNCLSNLTNYITLKLSEGV